MKRPDGICPDIAVIVWMMKQHNAAVLAGHSFILHRLRRLKLRRPPPALVDAQDIGVQMGSAGEPRDTRIHPDGIAASQARSRSVPAGEVQIGSNLRLI